MGQFQDTFFYKHNVYKQTGAQTSIKSKHNLSIPPTSKSINRKIINGRKDYLKFHDSLKNLENCGIIWFGMLGMLGTLGMLGMPGMLGIIY